MNELAIGILGVILLLIGILMRMPIAWIMGTIGIVGTIWLTNFTAGVSLAATVPFSTAANYVLCTIPMFVLMGNMLAYSGTSALLFRGVEVLLGRVRGGVAVVTLISCAIMAAATGSSVANAATMGNVAWPEMKKSRYDESFGTSLIAAGGTLGILIPPSTGFILYGVLTEQSIGKLFMAGLMPGIMLVIVMIAVIQGMLIRKPELAPLRPESIKLTPLEYWVRVAGILPMLLTFVVCIGGIYVGIFTPTEGGAIGALMGFICLLIWSKDRKQALWESLKSTIKTTCMIFAIMFGAYILTYFIGLSNLPMVMASSLTNSILPPVVILLIICLIYFIFGMLLDAVGLIVLLTPIAYPIAVALGFDPLWFGVIVVLVAQIGLITPPVGVNCYVIAGAIPDVPLTKVFKGVWPWVFAMLIAVAILIAFPNIALWLPSTMH